MFLPPYVSYMLIDNFQRGIFKWPLVFGWNALSEDYIRKHNITVSDPIRYFHLHILLCVYQVCFAYNYLFIFEGVLLWLEGFFLLTKSTSMSLVPMTLVWMCGVERTWRFHLRYLSFIILLSLKTHSDENFVFSVFNLFLNYE